MSRICITKYSFSNSRNNLINLNNSKFINSSNKYNISSNNLNNYYHFNNNNYCKKTLLVKIKNLSSRIQVNFRLKDQVP